VQGRRTIGGSWVKYIFEGGRDTDLCGEVVVGDSRPWFVWSAIRLNERKLSIDRLEGESELFERRTGDLLERAFVARAGGKEFGEVGMTVGVS
jgi:hypothetical protein